MRPSAKADEARSTSIGTSKPRPLHALTSIRAVFSLMVVATHFSGYHPGLAPAWVGPLGNVAVSWFFILSGFILTYNFTRLSGPSATAKFLVSRFWRLFPVQVVTVAGSCLLFSSSLYLARSYPLYLLRSLTLTHSWEAIPFASQAFNVPAWSISVEWFFYLMFPLLVARGWRMCVPLAAVSTFLALAWATGHGCWAGQQVFQNPGDSLSPTCFQITLYWPPARLWEFVLGMGLCSASGKIRNSPKEPAIQLLLACLLLLFLHLELPFSLLPQSYYSTFFGGWLFYAVAGSLIIFALSLAGPLSRLLSIKPLIFAGEISFSLYMTHMLVLRFADEQKWAYDRPAILQFALIVGVSMTISAAMFLLVERPSRMLLKWAFVRAGSPTQLAIRTT